MSDFSGKCILTLKKPKVILFYDKSQSTVIENSGGNKNEEVF